MSQSITSYNSSPPAANYGGTGFSNTNLNGSLNASLNDYASTNYASNYPTNYPTTSTTKELKELKELKDINTHLSDCSDNSTLTSKSSLGSQKHRTTFGEKLILVVALFLKGGLLGAYIPFFTLWLHVYSYTATQVGILSAVDIVFSILLMPLIGINA